MESSAPGPQFAGLTARQSFIKAIARVNRVFKDKPSGLVVDYLGLAELI